MNHRLQNLARITCVLLGLMMYNTLPIFAQNQDQGALAYTGATPTTLDDPSLVKQYQATISESDLASHLYVFASDYFEGRETATRGQKLAAYYLAAQYRKMGIAPKGTAETEDAFSPENYLQPFPLYGKRLQAAKIQVLSKGKKLTSSVFSTEEVDGKSFLAFGNKADAAGGVVFGGYAIGDEALGYDDFKAMEEAGIDFKDKWLMVMVGEPMENEEKSLLPTEDGGPSKWTAQNGLKWNSLFRRGLPRGLLIVGDVGPTGDDIAMNAKESAPSVDDLGNLSLNESQGGGREIPPFYFISSSFANEILAPSKRTIAELQGEIDGTLKPVVFELDDIQVNSSLAYESFDTTSENVVAFIEGSDPELKDEVVVISSHYDHIGLEKTGEDRINNGADDDGSGTVAILEIAEAFKMAADDGYGPRRSILFLNVSGEEKGLLGSAYYADQEPIIPLENTVTNLNIDMIGRFDPTHPTKSENYVYIIGSNLISQQLHDLNADVNKATGIELELDERYNSKDDPNQFYRRSDHWNFGKNNVPFIFFFTGTHEDYHGVDDEADKIEYTRLKRIAQLIFATGWQVANQDERPAVSGKGFN